MLQRSRLSAFTQGQTSVATVEDLSLPDRPIGMSFISGSGRFEQAAWDRPVDTFSGSLRRGYRPQLGSSEVPYRNT